MTEKAATDPLDPHGDDERINEQHAVTLSDDGRER
jgi:hypothetical protein